MDQPRSNKPFNFRKILVVEDDPGLLALIVKTLIRSGFDAQGASDGKKALEAIKEDPQRVILIDHQLPDMNGMELVRKLKVEGNEVNFISMTGQGDEKLAVEMMKLGASDYLVKEIGFISLLPGILERVFRNIETEVLLRKEQESRAILEKEIEIARNTLLFKQKFLASISHEIRTPLTGVIGTIELLEKTGLDDRQFDLINTLRQSSENLSEIIDQVLDYSRIEAGRVNLNKTGFCIDEFVQEIEGVFNSLCRKPVIFNTLVEKNFPVSIIADEKRILQIVNNLLVNAVKFTEQGEITLEIRLGKKTNENAHLIEFSVSDTGIGISEENLKNIFTPFSQFHQIESPDYSGTGLGLSICKELVELHGGRIEAESKVGKGSTFRFYIEAEISDTKSLMKGKPNQIKVNNKKSLRVLLVEDKLINQKVINLLLTALGHKVIIAGNGSEALKKFRPGIFDLILMDIQMPVMDGITATRMLRDKYKNELPPVVGLSANAFEGDRERYLNQGMDDYLTKPVRSDDFITLIDKIFAH